MRQKLSDILDDLCIEVAEDGTARLSMARQTADLRCMRHPFADVQLVVRTELALIKDARQMVSAFYTPDQDALRLISMLSRWSGARFAAPGEGSDKWALVHLNVSAESVDGPADLMDRWVLAATEFAQERVARMDYPRLSGKL